MGPDPRLVCAAHRLRARRPRPPGRGDPADDGGREVRRAGARGQLGQPCVPVATNVGWFWPKRGILRKPGTAVVEFLDPIQPGLEIDAFMVRLEDDASDRLLDEARASGGLA